MRSQFNLLQFALLATAIPLQKRTASQIDLTVLQFAHVLEQLETTFYSQALQKFQTSDFISAGFSSADVAIQQFQSIQFDEQTHTTVLEQTIRDQGGEPIMNCQFNFDSALKDVATMAATARTVELVGVSAYLGAASLVVDPQLLTAAASILTVEARHQSMLNVLSGTGVAIPSAFDIPLSPPQVLALAGSFISGCDLGIKGNTPLTITNTGSVGVGTSLTFDMSAMGGMDTSNFTCQMITGGTALAISQPLNNCVVPQISGPVAIFIVDNAQPLLNSQFSQFGASVKLGPTLAFIDSKTETIAQLARSGGPSADSSSVVSPAEASSIQASGTQTGSSAEATAPSSSISNPAGSGQQTDANTPIQQPGGPNFAVGKSGDGHTIVNGWQNLPSGITPPSS